MAELQQQLEISKIAEQHWRNKCYLLENKLEVERQLKRPKKTHVTHEHKLYISSTMYSLVHNSTTLKPYLPPNVSGEFLF